MPTVTVYQCAGDFCMKTGNPISNATFQWIEYKGKTHIYHDIGRILPGGPRANEYTFALPTFAANVSIAAPFFANSVEYMENFQDYVVRLGAP